MKRILIVSGDAGEALEILYPKFRLHEEGWQVVVAAQTRRPILSVVHDFEPDFDTYTEKPGYRIPVDASFDEVDPGEYDGLVIPGGRAPEYLRNRTRLVEIVRHFVDANKPIAATCHSALILIAAGGIAGRRMTCYPELEPDLKIAGAKFEDREVVIDGKLVTARAWPDNGPWMREFIHLVK